MRSVEEQVNFNRLGVSATGFLKLMRSHFDSRVVQDETILQAFNGVAGDSAVVNENVFQIVMDHLRDTYADIFRRAPSLTSLLSDHLSREPDRHLHSSSRGCLP